MAEAAATFDDVVALAPQHEQILRAIRALASELHPSLVEVSRPGDRAVSWGWGPRKMSEAYACACALPYKDYVNLAFYRGAFLPDPNGLLRGTSKSMRHTPITQLSQVADLDHMFA